MPLVIDRCPSCSGELRVRELYCAACELTLRGDFEGARAGTARVGSAAGAAGASLFPRLSEEQLAFLRLFVRARGNLTEVERTLGVSYPTVRAKLDDLITALAEPTTSNTSPPPEPRSRREVLLLIEQGRLSAADGVALLKRLASKDS